MPEINSAPLLRLSDLLDDFLRDADARHQAKQAGRAFGPLTGLGALDGRLGGALSPGLHVLHGSPGVGKTAFTLQAAAGCGCPALYVTCEMSPLELLRRHTARVTQTFLGRFKSGELSGPVAVGLAKRAIAEAPHLAILDATQVPASPDALLLAAEVTRRLSDTGHLLTVVDSLHSWSEGLGAGDMAEYERLNESLAALRALAKRLDAPMLVIAERNRAAMRSGGQSAGAGTRKIEYGAETVLELQVEDNAKPDASGEIFVELRISKNRNGAAGKPVSLTFHGALQRYTESPL